MEVIWEGTQEETLCQEKQERRQTRRHHPGENKNRDDISG